jgi:hypothetical protein
MMVGYTHNPMTLWRIWDPNFRVIRAQLEDIFDEKRNAYVSCTTDGIDIFGLPEDAEYIEVLHTADGLLRVQDTRDGDGLLRAQNTAIGTGGDDFSTAVPRLSVERVNATEVVIPATLMMLQMSIAFCPKTTLVEVSLHVHV